MEGHELCHAAEAVVIEYAGRVVWPRSEATPAWKEKVVHGASQQRSQTTTVKDMFPYPPYFHAQQRG